jgi:hypothetical protein
MTYAEIEEYTDKYMSVMRKLEEKKREEEEKRLKAELKQIKKEEKVRLGEGQSFKWSEILGYLSQFLFFNSGKRRAANGMTPPSCATSKSMLIEVW